MKLTRVERWMLWNQYRILEALYPADQREFEEAREALECGYEYQYDHLCRHVFQETLSKDECDEVISILEMFRALQHSYKNLEDKDGIEEWTVTFAGFDGNHETKQMAFARYFCKHDGGRFEDLEIGDRFSSHCQLLGRYRQMLAQWQAMGKPYDLTKEQLPAIASVR